MPTCGRRVADHFIHALASNGMAKLPLSREIVRQEPLTFPLKTILPLAADGFAGVRRWLRRGPPMASPGSDAGFGIRWF